MDQQTTIQCSGCLDNPNSLSFDHPQCSLHRQCTGWHFWKPENCKHCNSSLAKLETMNVAQVKSFLTDFRKMLEDMRSKLNSVQPDRFWEYDIVFNYFFRHFIHLDPARTDPITQSQANEINYSADLLQTEGQSETVSPEEDIVGEEDPFFGYSGSPVYSNSLTRNECNHEYCVYQNQDAQCNDPIHTIPSFKITQINNDVTPEQHSSKRKWSPANTGEETQGNLTPNINNFNTPLHRGNYTRMVQRGSTRGPSTSNASRTPHPTQYPRMIGVNTTPRYTAALSVASTPTHSMAGNYSMAHTPVALLPLPQEVAERDPTRPGKVYWRFNELLHERVGANQMKIKMMDPTNTFPTSYTSNIIYKPGNNNLFETTTEVASHLVSPYIREVARTAFMASYQLAPSIADLGPRNSSKKFLDSAIPIQSGLNLLQQEIQKMDIDILESATGCREDDILNLFKAEGFQLYNFVNFTGGWILTSDYTKFAKDTILSIRNFQNTLLTCPHEINGNTIFLAKERETRMVMIHSFSILHYQELFTGKVEAIPVDYRVQAELTPDLSRGICRMQMAQVKYNIARWMVAKMRIRKDILKDSSNCNVRWMYKQTLWDADIFPKDSITRLRGFNNNTLDVVELLGLKPRQQHQDSSTNANANKGANTYNKHPYKKQRTDSNPIQNKVYTDQNHNKKQGQNNQKTVTYNKNNSGNVKQNNNPQTKKQQTKNKKPFPKKNSNNTQ